MNTVQRILKNTAALTFSSIANTVIGFFFIVMVARYLGAGGFGVISTALGFIMIFRVLTDIGLTTLTIREVARDKSLSGKYLSNAAVIKLVLAGVTFGLVALVVNLIGYPQETVIVVYLIAVSVLLDEFSLLFYGIFQAHERMEFVTIGQVTAHALRLIGAVVVINQGFDIIVFGYLYIFASLTVFLFNSFVAFWKYRGFGLGIDPGFWRHLLKNSWPFGLLIVFGTIIYWIDTVMLSVMKGDEVVGWYNASYRVILFLLFVPTAYFYAVFPVMSRFFVSSREALRFTYEKSVKYMSILALPIAIGTTLVAGKTILLIFGDGYTESIIALQVLVWSVLFIFISSIIAQVFSAQNRPKVVAAVTGLCAAANIILNIILIPRYSYVGAGVATVITEFLALLLLFVWSLKANFGFNPAKVFLLSLKIIVSSAVMGIAVFYLDSIDLWWQVIIGASVYFGVLLLLRGLDRDDFRLMLQVIKRKQSGTSEDSEITDILTG
ncbi:flippase [Chloroflexota bacterium]